ncbi:2-amino-4-hydroxy-6-hydroxymethyldihydropteridine diphosphokinase [Wenyingzhuangia sp. IMCC45574]
MNTAYLSLGTNLGNKLENLNRALQKLSQLGTIQKVSWVYQTPPWGFKSDDFYNIALSLTTNLSAFDLIDQLLNIEQELGRTRKENATGYSARPLDIDIIFFNYEIINTEKLVIPHPRMHDRKFVLIPLLDLTSQYKHPVLKTSLEELLEQCTDNSEITKTQEILEIPVL